MLSHDLVILMNYDNLGGILYFKFNSILYYYSWPNARNIEIHCIIIYLTKYLVFEIVHRIFHSELVFVNTWLAIH